MTILHSFDFFKRLQIVAVSFSYKFQLAINCSQLISQNIQLPPALAGGAKLRGYEMALAKIIFFLAKAVLAFIRLSPAKAGGY